MTTILVVYDKGAAGPREIRSSLDGLADICFVIPDSPHTRAIRPMLAELGAVVPATAGDLGELAPDGIVTFSERTLPLTSRIAESLRLPFHSPETVRLLTDKYAQRRRLFERGVDPTRSYLVRDAEQARAAIGHVGVPAVVKPLRGEGSRNTHRLDSPAGGHELIGELLHAESRAGLTAPVLVVEEFLRGRDGGPYGDYVSVESVVSGGEVQHIALTGKLPLIPPFRETGQFWPSQLSPGERHGVLTLATDALRALGVRMGVTHTEIKLTDRGPRIIEVNGRLGGWIGELCGRTAHVDLIRAAAEIALGGSVTGGLFAGDRVYFQCYDLAPPEGGRLEAVSGIRELRAVPGVTGYRRLVHPGTTLDPGVTTYQLDAILGEVDRHEDMHTVIDHALSAIEFVFTLPGGATTRLTGLDLRDATGSPAIRQVAEWHNGQRPRQARDGHAGVTSQHRGGPRGSGPR